MSQEAPQGRETTTKAPSIPSSGMGNPRESVKVRSAVTTLPLRKGLPIPVMTG